MGSTRTAYESLSSSAAAASSSKHCTYDVFLSFRGEDTRNNFTGHLHRALKDAGINVFIDDEELRQGENITAVLVQAIQGSRISVIVFSRNYAESTWCLEELVKIMECKRTLRQLVLPIFYDVDPSDVRKQTGSFGEAFVKHEDRFLLDMDKVRRWRSALTEATNLSGWDLRNTADGYEAKFIRTIVDKITGQFDDTYLFEAVYPVGLNSRVMHMSYLLDVGLDDIRMIGILGTGGMGKTTIANAIYNKFYKSFEGKSFLANASETAKQPNGLAHLQKQLLSDILKSTEIKVDSVNRGINVIKERLRRKRVLVVIDDIDNVDQLNAIVRERAWFGSGSRIIITTRDEHLLNQLEVDAIYMAPEMDDVEALELFSWYAFRNSCPKEEFYELSRSVVSYCEGLPLALEVLGSFLVGRGIPEWESELEKLKRIPHHSIQEKLKLSYDGLNDDIERDIFLDISCFFLGMDMHYVSKILDGCGFSAKIGMTVLLERCLVTVNERNKLAMHGLLRDMGREIVREKSPRELGQRSRLWHDKDVTEVLTEHTGSKEIEGLVLNVLSSDKVSFSTEAFRQMQKLRLLQLKYVKLKGAYKYLSKELGWLCWHGFPLKSIPKDFHLQNAIAIVLKYSNLTHFLNDSGILGKLKILNLSHSHDLRQSPDFSKLPNLEQLILKDCKSLSEIHKSIGRLERLVLVDLRGCKLLKDLPRSLYKSKSIRVLLLSGCSKLENLSEDLGEMVSLIALHADKTAVRKVPFSITRLKNLRYLSLCGLKGSPSNSFRSLLRSRVMAGKIPKSPNLLLPSLQGLNSLQQLNLSFCDLTEAVIPKDFWSLHHIEYLDLSGNNFQTLPSLSGLSKLEALFLEACVNLHAIPDLPTNLRELNANFCPTLVTTGNLLEMSHLSEITLNYCPRLIEISNIGAESTWIYLEMEGCNSITTNLIEILLQGWNLCRDFGVFFSGSDIPAWFPYVGEGHCVTLRVSEEVGRFNGLVFCISHSLRCREGLFDRTEITVIDYNAGTIRVWMPSILPRTECTVEDQLWVGLHVWNEAFCTFDTFDCDGNAFADIAVIVDFGPECNVKKIGVGLVQEEFTNGKMMRYISISSKLPYGDRLWMISSEWLNWTTDIEERESDEFLDSSYKLLE